MNLLKNIIKDITKQPMKATRIELVNHITISKDNNGEIILSDPYNDIRLNNEEAKQLFTFLDENIEWRTEEEIEEDKLDRLANDKMEHYEGLAEERKLGHI